MNKFIALFMLFLLVASLFGQEKGKENDYYDWLNRYEKAKANVSMWEYITGTGIGVSILSIVLYFTDTEEKGYIITYKERKNSYLITSLVGAGISFLASSALISAKGKLLAIEKEGRLKGYIKAQVFPLAISIQLSW
ncbi:MAG: hypothetical protein J7L26_07675 [Candidatus Aminicenantes bacterium]|nr:hypothetical protein [Candidatus Aminicenantes bacterium]